MKRRKRTLKEKIFFYMLAFCGLLLGILWFFQTFLLTDMYRNIRTRELDEAISMVEKEIDNPNLNEVVERIGNEFDVRIMQNQDFILPPPIYPARNRQDNNPLQTITETREFVLGNGEILSLTFYALVVPVSATINVLHEQLLHITVIMIFLSIILAIILSKRIAKPIEEVAEHAKSLPTGNYEAEFKDKEYYEIMELSETLNQTAMELKKVERLRQELLANISHDLRTPLALIYSYAEMMNDFPEEINENQFHVIMDEAKRLTSLLNDVLDLSNLESNMGSLELSHFNLTNYIKETIEHISKLLSNQGYNFDFKYSEQVYLKADNVKIGRVIYNLITNAVNYTGSDKRVVIVQEVILTKVRISIIDTGEGIAREDLPLIWDRYYKSSENHKRAVAGSGLGLSIVKTIIDLHDGIYGVESEIGEGSTFWFEIRIK